MPTNGKNKYDVFLSYTNEDSTNIELIADRLVDEFELKVWFDKWSSVPGQAFANDIANGLNSSKCVAIMVGNNTPKGWFQIEIKKALNMQSKNEFFRIIPVILPKSNPTFIHEFLDIYTWVHFKNGIEDNVAWHRLVSGIKGRPPGRHKHLIKEEDAISVSHDGETIVDTQSMDIEITLKGKLEDFTDERKIKLLNAIDEFLDLNGNVKIKKKRRGSIKVKIELPADKAEKLKWAIKSGLFDYLGVTDAEVMDPDQMHYEKIADERRSLKTYPTIPKPTNEELLSAGSHFGHLKRKWNPHMAKFIFMERNGIHIIDLNKTIESIEEAQTFLSQLVSKKNKKILFVATKKQAKNLIKEIAQGLNMPYVTERWLGGMLTNFATIRKSIKKLNEINRMEETGLIDDYTKKEKLVLFRERKKLEKTLGGMSDLTRLPAALIVIDVGHEKLAVNEAYKLDIPIIGIVDTNSDPRKIDIPIPANDDESKSIQYITSLLAASIEITLLRKREEKDDEN